MQITSLTLSQDRTTLDLVISDAATVSSLRLWKVDTFKDYSEAVDLSTSLTGSATETLSFTPSDLGEIYFDGVYFVEAEDPDEVSLDIVLDATRYNECIITKVVENGICEECLAKEFIPMINAYTMVRALESAVQNHFIDEIINITSALDIYCSNTCRSCGNYDNIIEDGYYELNNS